jgi:hydrogenase maturation protease
MKRVLIAGIGNVLLGDDGVGPYVLHQLETGYTFEEGVKLEDLGTPALDFIDHIAGLDALIVVDSVENGKTPGSITLYRREDLLRHKTSIRMDTHSPAITECLAAAEVFFGAPPTDILLIGISAETYAAGCTLSRQVQSAVETVVHTVLAELDRLGVTYRKNANVDSRVWWSEAQPA